MSKILVKEIALWGRISGPEEKYFEPPSGPTHYDVKETYETIDKFLREKGETFVPEMFKSLPFIEEGFITSAAAISCYGINDCLIVNGHRPYFDRNAHIIQSAVMLENEPKMDETFDFLKDKAGWRWKKYWKKYGDRKIIDIPEKLENIIGLLNP